MTQIYNENNVQGSALYLQFKCVEVHLCNTGNDRYSGHGYSGIDRYSGTKNPDDAILFTVSGITVLVELFLEDFGTFCQFSYIFYAKSNDL